MLVRSVSSLYLIYLCHNQDHNPVRRLSLCLLITLTCFNLAGGYAMAATLISQASASAENMHLPNNPHQHKLKKSSYDVQAMLVNNIESEEDDRESPYFALGKLNASSQFSPEFRLLNKHFLVHYSAAIKDKSPAVYLLHHNFRL